MLFRGSARMRRGEIWTVAGGPDYAGKPRPVLIVQSDAFDALGSITVCPFTTDPADLPLLRLEVLPAQANGLRAASRIMIDKVSTVPRIKLGDRIGQLQRSELLQVDRALLIFLGLAG